MPEIQMPKLSDTMTEGTLVAWKKKKGDQISAGEVVDVTVGDCQTSFTLSSRGAGKSAQGSIALKLPKNGTSNVVGFKIRQFLHYFHR